ncbi:MAG: hypothetical protein NTU69_03730 [Proteobacteria bacterium]|nr:hypothetical protein [Pseudomonadota bacterium]
MIHPKIDAYVPGAPGRYPIKPQVTIKRRHLFANLDITGLSFTVLNLLSCPTHSLTDMYIYYNTQSMPEAIFSISRFEILTLFTDVKNKQRSGIFNKKALEGLPSRA